MPTKSRYLNQSSIFVKAALLIAGVVGLVAFSISYLNERATIDLTRNLVVERGLAEAELLGSTIYGAVKFEDRIKIEQALRHILDYSDGQGLSAAVLKPDGEVLVSVSQPSGAVDVLIRSAKENADKAMVEKVMAGDHIFMPVQKITSVADDGGQDAKPVGIIALEWSSSKAVSTTLEETRRALSFVLIASLVIVALTMILISKGFLKPLLGLSQSIFDIRSGNLDASIPGIGRKDELGAISASVEDLRVTLKSNEGIRRDAAYKSSAFMAASASLMLTDSDLKIRYINPAMIALFQRLKDDIPAIRNKEKTADVVGMSMEDFHTNGDQIRRRLANLNGQTFKTTVVIGDARVSLSITAVSDDNGSDIGFIMEWDDVTRDWLNKSILDAIDSDQMRADFDINGNILWANTPLCDAVGSSVSELKGKNLRSLVGPVQTDGKQSDDMIRIALDRDGFKGQMHVLTQKGAPVTLEGGFTCVRDIKNNPIRFMLLGRDVTRQVSDIKEARATSEALERAQTQVVEALRVGLHHLSNGDLTSTIVEPFSGSYEDLRVAFNQTIENLSATLREIADNAESIRTESGDISNTADGLSRRTENTAATLEQTAAALDELTSSVKVSAQGASEADKAVRDAKKNAEQSGDVVLETVSAMDQISESSDKITSIIKVIDDIAFQTNLLALNAGVEAARAGDAGRGFAVVASEVRALAQRSSEAAREINDLIAKSGNQVKRGVDLVGKTGEALQEIVGSVSKISELVSVIAESSQQQSLNLAEINQSVNQLDQSTQQNAARLEETTAASESLRKDAVTLVEAVSHFKILGHVEPQDAVLPFKAKPRGQSSKSEEFKGAAKGSRVLGLGGQNAKIWEDF